MTEHKKQERTPETRIYEERGRFYGDFRDHAAVGGGEEALRRVGSQNATMNYAEALQLTSARLDELERLRLNKPSTGEARELMSPGATPSLPSHLNFA